MIPITQEAILSKLEIIYQAAIRTDKWRIALQVTKLQGAYIGLFDKRRFPDVKRISEMSQRELQDFVVVLEKHEPELKNMRERDEQGLPKQKPLLSKHPPPCVCPECLSYE